ncbi:hypothetical protein TgHK011_008828 [Trichoderma gracile]|nr:hypothetical protein TgHK011_008828 [Trichoderma gracile]
MTGCGKAHRLASSLHVLMRRRGAHVRYSKARTPAVKGATPAPSWVLFVLVTLGLNVMLEVIWARLTAAEN